MAGIGFRLQKVLQKDTYADAIKAYFYSALILSGPWILSILSFFFLSYFNPKTIDMYELVYFKSTIIYIFAFSLIFVGILYLSLNRYLSDKLFLQEQEAIVPIVNSASVLVLVMQTIIGCAFFFSQGIKTPYCIMSVMIYLVISMIWVVLMGLFRFLISNKDIVLAGLFYNLAIWIDKIVFWASPDAMQIYPLIRIFPVYDSVVFLAYMTIIPALSIFLIEVETDFYVHYKDYYTQVLGKAPLSAIMKAKTGMAKSLRKSAMTVITCQGIVTIVVITFAPEITSFFNMQAVQIPIFRITTLGAFLHSILLIAIIVILYFDLRRLALIVTLMFVVTNGIFTYFTISQPLPYIGYGYFFSVLITLAFAFYALDYKLKRLEYITFALQPLAASKEE